MRRTLAPTWRTNPVLVALLAASGACTGRPTDVTVSLDTDVPVDRPMQITVTAYAGSSTSGTGESRTWTRGAPPAGITLPASFGIVPASGAPLDETVALVVTASVTPEGPAGSAPIVLRRFARFAFQPGHHGSLTVYLSLACTAPSPDDCAAGPCSIGTYCDEHGTTCDRGHCVSVDMTPQIVQDGGGSGPGDAMWIGSDLASDVPGDGPAEASALVPTDGAMVADDVATSAAGDDAAVDARDGSVDVVDAGIAAHDAGADVVDAGPDARDAAPDTALDAQTDASASDTGFSSPCMPACTGTSLCCPTTGRCYARTCLSCCGIGI